MLSIIVARASNNAIGKDNDLLWHLSADLKRFKSITTGHSILMGRKTFESLPKVLPNRHHYILTRDKNFTVDSNDVTIIHSLDDCINKFKNCKEEVFVIGGGEIYNLLYPHCSKLYLTNVLKDFDADVFFPQIDLSEWDVIHKSDVQSDEKSGLNFEFVDLLRK